MIALVALHSAIEYGIAFCLFVLAICLVCLVRKEKNGKYVEGETVVKIEDDPNDMGFEWTDEWPPRNYMKGKK